MSDPVDGRYYLIQTTNGGSKWKAFIANDLPATREGEAAFAASGTCLIIDRGEVFIVSGGNDARVFRLVVGPDGYFWQVSDTPIVKGRPGSGIFSVAIYDRLSGVIVGGDYEKPDEAKDNLAFTTDRGLTWKLGAGLSGYRSAVAYIDKKMIVTVGTNGSDITHDGGKTWKKFGSEDLNAVAAKGKKATWAVGAKGLVVKMK